MNLYLRSLFLFFLSVISSSANGEAVWISRQFKPSDGLAYQVVRDIVQTPDGDVVFATWGGGLSKFNGSQWETLNEGNDWSDLMTRCLAYDDRGVLWVGAMEGVKSFDGQRWVKYSHKTTSALSMDANYAILPRKNGETWFGMKDGYLYSFNPQEAESRRWRLVCDPSVFHNKTIRCLLEMDDGSIWVGGDCAYQFDGVHWTEHSLQQNVYSLCKTKEGSILACGNSSVCRFTGTSWEILDGAGREARCVVETQNGSLIVGASHGVRIYQHGVWQDLTLSQDASNPFVEAIRSFDDGSIWIGTRNGVYLVRQSDWSVFVPPSPEYQIAGKRFVASPEISPRIITPQGEIVAIQKEDWAVIGAIDESDNDVEEIFRYEQDRLAVHRQKTLAEYNATDFSVVRKIPLLNTAKLQTGYQTADGTFGLYGLEGEGIYRWTGLDWKLDERKSGRKNERFQLFRETRDGTKWMVFSDAIEPIGQEYPWLDFYTDLSFRGHRITDICVAQNGWIWFGSSGSGIFVYDGQKIRRYTTQNGLPSDWILCLYEASDGTMWAGMDNSSVASFRDDRWIAFSKEETQLEGHVAKIAEDSEGALWFVLEPTGLARYRPSSNSPDTAVDVYPVDIVPKGMGIFSFHGWDAWHTTMPKDLVYSWRIFEKRANREIVPWTPFKTTSTIYSPQLNPGNYVFEVRSADKERNIDPVPAAVQFTVEPYLFMKPAFWIPITLFTILAIFSLRSVYLKHLALRESEKWLSQAQRIAHIGHWIADLSRDRLFLSQETFRILGATSQNFQNSIKSYLRFIHPKDRQAVIQNIRDAIKENPTIFYEHRIIRPDGSLRIVQVQSEIDKKDFNSPYRMMGTIQDITDKRRLEEETRRMHTLEAIGVLAGGIAHDFNNLLTIILGNIALAKSSVDPNEKVHHRLSESEKATQRAHALTQQLIAFSKGNAAIKKISSLSDVVKYSALSVVEGTNVRCEYDIPSDLRLVLIDQGQFNQLIRNITRNSLEAMPNGGGIRIRLENVTVEEKEVVLLPKGNYVKITIEDDGCGIPPENLSKIFDPYFTTKDNVTQKGLGLGLAICFSIVKQHKAHINVESEVGVGTKVSIYVPASTEKILD